MTNKETSKTATTVKTESTAKPVATAAQKETAKPAAKPAETKKEAEKSVAAPAKETAKKTAPAKKAAKKAPAKKKVVEKVEEICVQFGGQEIMAKDIVEKAKQDYVADGHRESSIKSVRVYIKPEENMAYYVVNDKFKGEMPV